VRATAIPARGTAVATKSGSLRCATYASSSFTVEGGGRRTYAGLLLTGFMRVCSGKGLLCSFGCNDLNGLELQRDGCFCAVAGKGLSTRANGVSCGS